MVTIELQRPFWITALLTAHELYEFADKNDQIKSMECLGWCWGDRDPARNLFVARYASVTQLIEHRDEGSVIGPDPFTSLLHQAWAGLDLADVNPLGNFHSHPWSAAEVDDIRGEGEEDPFFWEASDADKESMGPDMIEVIVALRPITKVDATEHLWAERGLIVSGKHDVKHVAISGWHKDDQGNVTQAKVQFPDCAFINDLMARIDARR
jgi:hypothetical protein